MIEFADKIDSKFRFILLAAKRARQIQAGSKPLVHTTSRKPTRIAQEELRAGVVGFEYQPLPSIESESKGPVSSKKSKK